MSDRREKSTLVALILWVFLGWLGFHRLYAGRTTSFIIWIIVAIVSVIAAMAVPKLSIGLWAGLLVWWVVDFFLIVSQNIFIKDQQL